MVHLGYNLECYGYKTKIHQNALILEIAILYSSMPNKKLSKEENQPPITTLLPNCTKKGNINRTLPDISANSANNLGINVSSKTADLTIDVQPELNDKEFIEVESFKKRKRRNHSSGSPINKPSKKIIMENPAKANNDVLPTSPTSNSQAPLNPIPEVILSPELLELERRLNKTMTENIANEIKTALKPLQESIENVQKSSDLIIMQESRIKELTEENVNLHSEISKVKTELNEFKERLTSLENKSLECNLIFRGVEEPANETIDTLKEKIYWLLADTVDNPVASERLAAAKSLGIYRCRRLGWANPVRPRPNSVEFENRNSADAVSVRDFTLPVEYL